MTLVSDIIHDAYRQSNILAINGVLTSREQAEGLRHLNRLVLSVLGNEVGNNLYQVTIGENNVLRKTDFSFLPRSSPLRGVAPHYVKVFYNISQEGTSYLDNSPPDGARFAVQDKYSQFSSFPQTIHANGRSIEGSPFVTLSQDGESREWIYRADKGEWLRLTPLETFSEFPFPPEFDLYFILLLAAAINPSHGTPFDNQNEFHLKRARTQLRARYRVNQEHTRLDRALSSNHFHHGRRYSPEIIEFPEFWEPTSSGGVSPPPFLPSLDFTIPENSMYISIIL